MGLAEQHGCEEGSGERSRWLGLVGGCRLGEGSDRRSGQMGLVERHGCGEGSGGRSRWLFINLPFLSLSTVASMLK